MKKLRKPIAHAVRLQIPCCLYPRIPTEENLRGDSAASGRDFSRAGEAEGKSHLGRAFEGRSRPRQAVGKGQRHGRVVGPSAGRQIERAATDHVF